MSIVKKVIKQISNWIGIRMFLGEHAQKMLSIYFIYNVHGIIFEFCRLKRVAVHRMREEEESSFNPIFFFNLQI